MDYEGETQGLLQRKEQNSWPTYHMMLVKDRLLICDIDKQKGKRAQQIKEIIKLSQYSDILDLYESLADESVPKGSNFQPECYIILKAGSINQQDLYLRSNNKKDVSQWRIALSEYFNKPKGVDNNTKLKKNINMTQRRLKTFTHLAESFRMSQEETNSSQLLRAVQDVIVGVRDTLDNTADFRVTLPRGLNSLSDLDDIQTQLHRALSMLVLWTNRKVMLTGSKGCEEEGDEQPEEEIENDDEAKRADDLVLPVNELLQKMMALCLPKQVDESENSKRLTQDSLEGRSYSSDSLLRPKNNASDQALFQNTTRYSNYSLISSHSSHSDSYNGSLQWSSYNQRCSILSSGSFNEDQISPDPLANLPPPHPSLLTDPDSESQKPPPLPPPPPTMLRSKSATLDRNQVMQNMDRPNLNSAPPLPPRSKSVTPAPPPLPPRGSQGSSLSSDMGNIYLTESHTYVMTGYGHQSSSSFERSSVFDYSTDYITSQGSHGESLDTPPPLPSRKATPYLLAGNNLAYGSEPGISHRSSGSAPSDSESDLESDADSGLEEEEPDEPPPIPPKSRFLPFSQLYSLRLQDNDAPAPPIPPRSFPAETKGVPASGVFPEGPPPTLPTRSNISFFSGARNYTRFIDKYAPSFEIDEEYFHMAVREPMLENHDLQENVYHSYHKHDLITRQKSADVTKSTVPPESPKTVGEASTGAGVTTDGFEEPQPEKVCILFEADPYPELIYNDENDAKSGRIKGGSVDALIAEATIYRDVDFVQTLVHTHTTFISTDDLLRKIVKRYKHFIDGNEALSGNCVKLFIDILGNTWMHLTKTMIDIANQFIKVLFESNKLSLALDLQNTLYTQFQYCKDHKSDLNYIPVSSVSSETLNWSYFLKIKPRDVALQMTKIDFDKFSKIKLCEILKYVKAPSETTSPNLCACVDHFNSVSYWASTLVLERETKDERQRVYRRLLTVMEHLIKFNNFSSSFALFAALSRSSVRRVINLSNKQEKILNTAQDLMDSTESYKNLRTALRSVKPPLIPYLAICIADLYFLILGNPDKLEGGEINFTKRYTTYTFMNVVRTSQRISYNIEPNDNVINFFNNFNYYMEEEAMWKRSEEIKPRKKRS